MGLLDDSIPAAVKSRFYSLFRLDESNPGEGEALLDLKKEFGEGTKLLGCYCCCCFITIPFARFCPAEFSSAVGDMEA